MTYPIQITSYADIWALLGPFLKVTIMEGRCWSTGCHNKWRGWESS